MDNFIHWKNTQIEDLPNEIWKPVRGYEKVEASNFGRIKCLGRYVKTGPNGAGERYIEPKVKNQVKGKDGYLRVDVFKNHKCKKETAHKICALAWKDNPENKKTVQHDNNIRHCNEEWNLKWFTHSEQLKYAYDNGNKISKVQNYVKKGENHYRYGKKGLPDRKIGQYDNDGILINTWDRIVDAIKETGITTIKHNLRGRGITAGGFVWKYINV